MVRALVSAGLITMLQSGSPAVLAAEPEGQQDIDWLRGLVYQQRPDTIGMSIDTPGIWIGLPADTSYLGGHLLSTPGNVESSQSLGIARMKIGGKIYFVFDLTSNASGRTDTRILDAVAAPAGKAMQPCDVAGQGSDELAAILDYDEARMVSAQQPSIMNQKPAVLVNPRHLVRFNSRTLRIERVISDQSRCVGYPF
jgi:hypothetical protein